MDDRRMFAAASPPAEAEPNQPLLFQRGRSRGWSRARGVRLRFAHVLLILALFAGFFFGLQRIALTALNSKMVALKTITVAGATDRTEASIRSILEPWRGTSLLLLDAAELRAELEGLSWVREAQVSKVWPSRLWVRVRERTAMALLDDNGALTLVDEEGVRLEAVDPSSAPGLPRLRSGDGFDRDYAAKISLARACLAGLPAERKKGLAVVDVSLSDRVGLELRDNPVRVYCRPDQASSSLDYFEQKVASWQKRFGRLAYVDLTVPERAYLGPVQGGNGGGPVREASGKEVL